MAAAVLVAVVAVVLVVEVVSLRLPCRCETRVFSPHSCADINRRLGADQTAEGDRVIAFGFVSPNWVQLR